MMIESKYIEKILNIVKRSRDPNESYGGIKFPYGYHSLNLRGVKFVGQRNNYSRLENVSFDFKNKTVLDIGCNSGGVLHSLHCSIKYGIGVDINKNYINIANLIKDYNNINNLHFYTFDIENQELENLKDFILTDKVDICFFLSMSKWIRNWTEVVNFCYSLCPTLLFESNGENQNNQERIVRNIYSDVTLIKDESLDGKSQKKRKLFLCKKIL